MNQLAAVLKSKTFWGGLAMFCGAIYAAYSGEMDKALALGGAALSAWGLRLAIAKN
jgi:hypothetical protein